MRRGVRLGVDVGTVRVGLASSDPDGLIATPVDTLRRAATDSDRPSTDMAAIAAEARERDAIEVVVGLPLSLSGSGGAAAGAARGYAVALARVVAPIPVRLVDERLTTVSAHQLLRSAGRPGRKQRVVVDQVAASLILQHCLDGERATGRAPGFLVEPTAEAEGPSPDQEARRS